MKFKKILKGSLAASLVFGSLLATGCKLFDDPETETSKKYQIYQMAVEAGVTDLTYEEWIASIKGEKGDATEVTIGGNGNWFIDGVDTNVPAAGVNGTTWYTGTQTPSVNIGREGDFYYNSSTNKIYQKNDGVWSEKDTLRDGTNWFTGEGEPINVIGAKTLDFYFDTENNDVYQLRDEWVLIADLDKEVEESEEFRLPAGVYQGYWGNELFDMTVSLNEQEELIVDHFVQHGVDLISTYEFFVGIDGDKVVVEIVSSSSAQAPIILDKLYFKLSENNILKTYIDDEEMSIIKGSYRSDDGVLTLGNTTYVGYYDGFKIQGTWDVVSKTSDKLQILLKGNNGFETTFELDCFSRKMNMIHIGDYLRGGYTFSSDQVVEEAGLQFNYDSMPGDESHIQLWIGERTLNVDVSFFVDKPYLLLLKVNDITTADPVYYVVNYITGEISLVYTNPLPLLGETLYFTSEYLDGYLFFQITSSGAKYIEFSNIELNYDDKYNVVYNADNDEINVYDKERATTVFSGSFLRAIQGDGSFILSNDNNMVIMEFDIETAKLNKMYVYENIKIYHLPAETNNAGQVIVRSNSGSAILVYYSYQGENMYLGYHHKVVVIEDNILSIEHENETKYYTIGEKFNSKEYKLSVYSPDQE